MQRKKTKNESARAIQDSLRREMAKPRMTRSARIAMLNLDPERIPEQSSVTLPGTVHRIIPSLGSRRTEKAQIAVDGAERLHRNFRIENALLDENGDDVKLKKGSRV